ncbi:MAG: hypothetical protein LBF28_03400 [Rickettsiales bacterium]|jgi:hypothetical protein|nr:hypothetical protein [Rickettsiales bacterium]
MKPRPSTVAQKLLNLYRQQHVILGGWKSVNQIFIAEADDDVLAELPNMPTGYKLARHIENLRSGKTPINSIDIELMPYDGMMAEAVASTLLSDEEISELSHALDSFVPDTDGLERIKSLNVVKKFGDEWQIAIQSALTEESQLHEKWNIVIKTARAYYLWKVANDMLSAPISERSRAQIQADLPEYETYLPLFGKAGTELLSKLRIFVSSV